MFVLVIAIVTKKKKRVTKMSECICVSCRIIFKFRRFFCYQEFRAQKIDKQLSLKLNLKNGVSHALDIFRFSPVEKKPPIFCKENQMTNNKKMCQIIIYSRNFCCLNTCVYVCVCVCIWCVRQLLVIWILEKQIQNIFTSFEWLYSCYIFSLLLLLLCFCSFK